MTWLQVVKQHSAGSRAWRSTYLLPRAQCGGEAGPPTDYTMAIYSYTGKHFKAFTIYKTGVPPLQLFVLLDKKYFAMTSINIALPHIQSNGHIYL